jgi:sugar-phosphatase
MIEAKLFSEEPTFSASINELSASEQISGKSEGAGKKICFVAQAPMQSPLSPISNHERNDVTLVCKAVLFDMDGTLVDSTAVVERAWSRWAPRHGIPVQAVLSFSHGRPTIATMERFLPGRDHTEELTEMARYEETRSEGILPVPGAAQAVNALQGLSWAIVTSAWRTLAEARLEAAGLPLPKVIVPVDEIRNGKPHPEGYLRAAERLRVAPEECIVFEDTRPGVEAGLNAGMQVVGLLTTFPAERLRHRPLIRDFRDVTIRPDGEYLQVELRAAVSVAER